jgi:signal transduction histidine kinase
MVKYRRRFHWPRQLYLRIYFAVLASLAIASLLFGAVVHFSAEVAQLGPGLEMFAAIAGEVLPPASAPRAAQQAVLARWRHRVHADLALYAPDGQQLAAVGAALPPSEPGQAASGWLGGKPPVFALKLPDGRWLLAQSARHQRHHIPVGLLAALSIIALVVALGAYPIVRRLTRRLERLQQSVDVWGAGQLSTRVAVEGQDEVARLAVSFNRAATHIQALVAAQQTLLANASHELRSPLARIRMAVELLGESAQSGMRDELSHNIQELDQLIDEILLSSRLDATAAAEQRPERLDCTALIAEECARVAACLHPAPTLMLVGDAKLIRRMVRNLLENARRHGGGSLIDVSLSLSAPDQLQLDVCDRGPGVPQAEREAIFAPFYRLPGARESEGGVGLGLSLVRQIAKRHGGVVQCLAREGGGSCFRVTLPGAALDAPRDC